MHVQSFGVVWLVTQYIAGVVISINIWSNIEEDSNGTGTLGVLPHWSFAIQAAFTCLFIYPHVGLVLEIKKGIMTPETYAREKFSCCCV